MYQIFSLNIVIFIILAPIYILLNARGLLGLTGFLAEFHVLVSALASVMVLEIIGNLRYALVGVYGVIFSLISSAGFLVLLYGFSKGDPTLVLFATLPVIWTSLGFVTVIAEMLYRWLWTLYGTDFLMSKTDFGVDYEGT
ncbi:hypothetical protein HYV58_00925, partial [Candidatus Peregrinibacteria bacterium]|nr:hypothetical protein [Candidatus Peregrinibacteria bacterium]